jgi:hypothetical protein
MGRETEFVEGSGGNADETGGGDAETTGGGVIDTGGGAAAAAGACEALAPAMKFSRRPIAVEVPNSGWGLEGATGIAGVGATCPE